MKSVLQQLYRGEICPELRYQGRLKEHEELYKRSYAHYQSFIDKLDSPLKEEFIHIMDEQLDACPLELSESFMDGFCLGAQMMIEVFQDKE